MVKKRITRKEVKKVLARFTVFIVGLFLFGDPLLDFLKGWLNASAGNAMTLITSFIPMFREMWATEHISIMLGAIIILAGLFVFEVK